jgi:hypothetical protein
VDTGVGVSWLKVKSIPKSDQKTMSRLILSQKIIISFAICLKCGLFALI